MALDHALPPLAAPHSKAARRELEAADLASFLIPAIVAFEIRTTGRLFVSELLLLAALPFLLVSPRRRPFTRNERTLLVLGVAWLWAQVVTDLIRATAFDDYSRGWLKIAFLLTNFAAITLLIADQRRRILLFAWGLVAGILINYLVSPSDLARADAWKFGIGSAITYAVVLVGCHPRVYRVPFLTPALLAAMALVALTKDFRSLGGECLIAAAYIAVQQAGRRRGKVRHALAPGRVLAIGAAAAVAGFGVLSLYGYAASRGIFGAAAASKYTHQATGKFGILAGGRPQVYAEWRAMSDSPLIGHGSWARNSRYNLDLLRALYRAGYRVDASTIYGLTHDDYVPVHSYILGAWVESGLLGGVFWIFVLFVAVGVLLQLYRTQDPLSPFIVLVAVSILWDLFFSPFGAEGRLSAAFFIVLLFWAKSLLPSQDKPDAPTHLAAAKS